MKLRDVPCSYNVVNISFIESTSNSDPTMIFRLDTVYVEKEGEFINDIKILKSRGVESISFYGGHEMVMLVYLMLRLKQNL